MLGRNLEAAITRAEELKKEWKDDFTSVEHLVLSLVDDPRFVRELLRKEGLDARKLTEAIKQIRGSNRVTDQVSSGFVQRISPGIMMSDTGVSPDQCNCKSCPLHIPS